MLQKHQQAPLFSSPNQLNQLVNLSDFAGKQNVVLYFYPKDDTPGCTIEANDFTRLAEQFAKYDAVVVGVSKDSCESHINFINKFTLKLELLADTTGDLCENYGVWREKEKNGIKSMAILRSTFIINKEGILVEAHYGVNYEGHAEEVLEQIKNRLYVIHSG